MIGNVYGHEGRDSNKKLEDAVILTKSVFM